MTEKTELEKVLAKLEAEISKARENLLIVHLDDYEEFIVGNAKAGRLAQAKEYAELLVTYYVGDNPYTPDQDKRINAIKNEDPGLHKVMDAARKMYYVGKAAEELAKLI